jgi:two-component system OmpR family response regulator
MNLLCINNKGMKKEKLMILIVEDSILIKERLKAMLLELDNVHQVLEAGTYEEAFRMLEQGVPNVLLLDLGLPGKSGIDLLRTIAQHKWELTIIVLTNQTSSHYKKLCLSIGAHHFLDKTKDFDKVTALVEAL